VHELVSRTAEEVVIEERGEIHGPRKNDRGKVVQVDEDHKARVETSLAGVARRVESTVVVKRQGGQEVTTRIRVDPVDPL
jgi:hypothetical protein